METKNRKTYEAPEAVVVKTQPEGIVCASNYVMWFLAEPDMSTTEAWGRGDYGGAIEI